MQNKLMIVLILGLLVTSCTTKTKATNEEVPAKDPSELTYIELYHLVLGNSNGGGVDYHGEIFGAEALNDLVISPGDNCDCGQVLMVTNNNTEKSINFAVKATFNIPQNPNNEMLRIYQINADSTISIGCSSLCYNDKEYKFSREILSAGYQE